MIYTVWSISSKRERERDKGGGANYVYMYKYKECTMYERNMNA